MTAKGGLNSQREIDSMNKVFFVSADFSSQRTCSRHFSGEFRLVMMSLSLKLAFQFCSATIRCSNQFPTCRRSSHLLSKYSNESGRKLSE